jgi:DNA polymerase-1
VYLAELFVNSTVIKVAHNLAFESMFLYARGIVLQAPVYDTIAAAQLTLKGNTGFRTLADSGLKTLVPALLDMELPSFSEVTAGRHFDELDPANPETVRYACADSDYTLRLYDLFNGWFDKWLPKHRAIVEQVESPTAVYVGLMKYNGLLMDAELMHRKADDCEAQLAKLREDIAFIVGDVNIGANASTAAFKQYLYKDLGLPVVKTTAKYQEAADEETFILLRDWCKEHRSELSELFDLLLEYRRIGKLSSTYVEGYLKHANPETHRIYPQFFQLGAESGRFSCRNPNVQNNSNDKDINTRNFIIAPEGISLIELDYSQIEARLAAFLSRDEHLLRIYLGGEDLHAMTTAAIYKIPLEEAMDKNHPQHKHRRTVAKATFFGFMYGMYGKTLQRNLKVTAGVDVTVEQAKAFLENLKSSYATLTRWQKDTITAAKRCGYAETLIGRRRYVPNIRSSDFIKAGGAERSALNHGVQGLAADILKLAMGRIICQLPCYLKPIFTVHDSLVFECPDDKVSETSAIIKAAMEVTPPIPGFDIPIIAEVSIGKSYGDMKEVSA